MASEASLPPVRRRRFWLYAPYAALVLAGIAWSAAWLVIRDRTLDGLDRWLAAERAGGRDWTCTDRAIGGYPFRIEMSCGALSLKRPGLEAAFGRLLAVAQIYRPRHIIAEIGGPLHLASDVGTLDARWRLFQASYLGAENGFERLSLTVDAPTIRTASPATGDLALSGEHLEMHVRPHPAQAAAYQAALSARGTVVPGLDALIGGTEPADLSVELGANEIRDLAARPLAEEAERWRAAGGILDVTRLALVKGPRRIEGSGKLAFDEAHRPMGQLDVATARLEGLLGAFTNGRTAAAGALLGLLVGQPAIRTEAPEARGSDTPRALPPLRLGNGRVQIGPIPIPGLRLPRLY